MERGDSYVSAGADDGWDYGNEDEQVSQPKLEN